MVSCVHLWNSVYVTTGILAVHIIINISVDSYWKPIQTFKDSRYLSSEGRSKILQTVTAFKVTAFKLCVCEH